MHESYHSEGFTDLSVIRQQADYRLRKERPQEETLVHLHPKGYRWADGSECHADPFTRDEEDKAHEWYLFDDLEADERPVFEAKSNSDKPWREEDTND